MLSTSEQKPLLALLVLTWVSLASVTRADERVAPHVHDAPRVVYPSGGDGQPARVELSVVVDAEGHATETQVTHVDREGDAAIVFDDAATAYVHALHFSPATIDGQHVAARVAFVVTFTPTSTPQSAPTSTSTLASNHEVVGLRERRPPENADAAIGSRPDEEATPTSASTPPSTSASQTPAHSFAATARTDAPSSDAPAASAGDMRIHIGALRDVPRRSAEDLLTLAPGVLLTNHSGEGHASAVFLRGFDAGEGQDLEFLVEGMPINEESNAHGHGYADTHFIIPELVSDLRVVEGPFDPRQGDFAVAGTAEYRLGLADRGLTARAEYGSFARRRLALLWGPEGMGPGTFVGVDLRAGDGFGPNRAFASVSAMGRYEASLGRGVTLAILAGSYASRFDSAGVIREDDFLARRLPCASDVTSQFYCTYDPNQGGSSTRSYLNASLEWRHDAETFTQQAYVQLLRSRFLDDFTGYLLDPHTDGMSQRGDGTEQLTRTTIAGLRGSLHERRVWLGFAQNLEVGYNARYDTGGISMDRLRRDGGAPYASVFDDDVSTTNIGVYVASDLRFLQWLAVRAGARVDAFSFGVQQNGLATVDRMGARLPTQGVAAYGVAFQPRGTIDITLLRGLDWLTSVGLGARSSDATALSDGELAPFADVRAADTGIALERDGNTSFGPWHLAVRSSLFYTHVSQDLLFDPTRSRNELVGPSNRFGALATARFGIGHVLDALLSATYTDAYQPPRDTPFYDLTAGPRLPFIPRWVVRADVVAAQHFRALGERFRASVSLGTTYIAPKPLPLGELSEATFVVDAGAKLTWRIFELGLQATNLLNARYHLIELNYVSNFRAPGTPATLLPERAFAAGPPLQILATFAIHLE